jgi:hypothetical protein
MFNTTIALAENPGSIRRRKCGREDIAGDRRTLAVSVVLFALRNSLFA